VVKRHGAFAQVDGTFSRDGSVEPFVHKPSPTSPAETRSYLRNIGKVPVKDLPVSPYPFLRLQTQKLDLCRLSYPSRMLAGWTIHRRLKGGWSISHYLLPLPELLGSKLSPDNSARNSECRASFLSVAGSSETERCSTHAGDRFVTEVPNSVSLESVYGASFGDAVAAAAAPAMVGLFGMGVFRCRLLRRRRRTKSKKARSAIMAAVAPIAMPAIAPPEMDVEREVEVAEADFDEFEDDEMVAVGSDDDRAVLAA
jgi:hypothetical protein